MVRLSVRVDRWINRTPSLCSNRATLFETADWLEPLSLLAALKEPASTVLTNTSWQPAHVVPAIVALRADVLKRMVLQLIADQRAMEQDRGCFHFSLKCQTPKRPVRKV